MPAADENVVVVARRARRSGARAGGRSGRRSPTPPGTARAGASFVSAFLVAILLTVAGGVHSAARPITKGKLPAVLVNIIIGPRALGRISSRLFGSNLLWPYNAEGAFDPSTQSFYPAFVDEVRNLGVTSLRYPAGITADSFDWLHAIRRAPTAAQRTVRHAERRAFQESAALSMGRNLPQWGPMSSENCWMRPARSET